MVNLDFGRLESNLKEFQSWENEMLEREVANDYSKWHWNCQYNLTNTFEQWNNTVPSIIWVSEQIVGHLQRQANCAHFCSMEDKRLQQENTLKLLNEQIETLYQKRSRSAKISPLVERNNQKLKSIDAFEYHTSKLLSQVAAEQLPELQK